MELAISISQTVAKSKTALWVDATLYKDNGEKSAHAWVLQNLESNEISIWDLCKIILNYNGQSTGSPVRLFLLSLAHATSWKNARV